MRGRGVAMVAGMRMGQNRAEQQAQAKQQAQAPQQQTPAPAATSAPANVTGELQKLAQLHQSGALSDQEFAAAKQKLLSG